mgnify:CR=1 FL=1
MLFGRKKEGSTSDIEIGAELDKLPGGAEKPPDSSPAESIPLAPVAGPIIENPAHFDARMQRIEAGLEGVMNFLQGLKEETPRADDAYRDAAPPANPGGPAFYEQLIDYGEDAILNNPRIMGAIENRLRGQSEYDAARLELANKIPEAYDSASPVHRTREAIRGQFEQLGVHPSVLNSRVFEELFTNAAIGKNIDAVISSRQKSGLPLQAFVEGSRTPTPGGGFGEFTAEQLGEAELITANRFGVSPAEYAKNLNQMIKNGVIERR